jgi:hypothetical protein
MLADDGSQAHLISATAHTMNLLCMLPRCCTVSFALLLRCQAYWFIDFYTLDWGREKIEEFMDTCQVRTLSVQLS